MRTMNIPIGCQKIRKNAVHWLKLKLAVDGSLYNTPVLGESLNLTITKFDGKKSELSLYRSSYGSKCVDILNRLEQDRI